MGASTRIRRLPGRFKTASGTTDAAAGGFVAGIYRAAGITLRFSIVKRGALLLLCAAALAGRPDPLRAQKAVFVVRHAEKVSESDQRLTEAGRARANRLSSMLADSGVSLIYATDTERARDTAKPLADRLRLKIETYDTGGGMSGAVDARPFVEKLRREHPHDVVLIVGHSNTIPDLLHALGCEEKITLASDEYDNLFVVVTKPGATATLLRLRY
jgi:phosphohistidine phosphatase SixA